MNSPQTNDSERRLSDRDIPSLIGASTTPSMWEIYNRIKGKIEIGSIQSTRSWWRRALFPTVMIGLQERYKCVLSHGRSVLTEDGIEAHPVTSILNFGQLPFRPGLTHLKLRQASSHEIAMKWKNGQGYSVPASTAAELHPIMAHLGIDRLGIVLIVDGGAEEVFVELQRSDEMVTVIKDAIAAFNARLVFDDEPDPDFNVDGDEIQKLYRPLTEEILDLQSSNSFAETVATYERLAGENRLVSAKARDLKARMTPLKAEITKTLGTAKGAKLAGGAFVERTETQVKESTQAAYSYQTISVKHKENA